MIDEEEDKVLFHFIESRGYQPICVVNTHCHIDHILGNKSSVERFGVPLYASRGELAMLELAPASSLKWGIPYRLSPDPDRFLQEGDVLEVGGLKLDIVDVPGHSPGHIALISHAHSLVLGGDVLFRGSVGRTDLPMSDAETLFQSIREKLYTLPEHYVVLPGHGPETTIGDEMVGNPFVRKA